MKAWQRLWEWFVVIIGQKLYGNFAIQANAMGRNSCVTSAKFENRNL